MLHRLCGPPSIPLSFSLAAVLPRRGTYCVSDGTEGVAPPAPSTHRLRRGLPGYLILFAPHAVAPQRQQQPSRPPSPPMFFPISTHSTATPGIPPASTVLEPDSLGGSLEVEPRDFTPTYQAAYAPFTPSDSGQRSHPLYYRGCWHRVSRCFLWRYRQIFVPPDSGSATRRPSSHTRRRCVRLSPIAQYSPLLPPVGVWAVSQSQCGWSSSRTSYLSSPW